MKYLRLKPYKDCPQTLGEHLRKRRIGLCLLQKDVAKRLRVNEWTYLGWEHDRHKPAVRFFPRIIEFLGYDPDPAPRTLGERIAAKRRQLGLSIKRAAALLGMDEGTLKRHECGALSSTDAKRRARIKDFLGETPHPGPP